MFYFLRPKLNSCLEFNQVILRLTKLTEKSTNIYDIESVSIFNRAIMNYSIIVYLFGVIDFDTLLLGTEAVWIFKCIRFYLLMK
jgi:hypothetical protein